MLKPLGCYKRCGFGAELTAFCAGTVDEWVGTSLMLQVSAVATVYVTRPALTNSRKQRGQACVFACLAGKVEEGVGFHEVVLNGGACQDDAALHRDSAECLVDLRLGVLYLVSLHAAQVFRFFSLQDPRQLSLSVTQP